jgi:hypothetical protein
MYALEYCRASLHLETNYGNCIINDGPSRALHFTGGEINRNNNVTSNTANFPLFALAHTLAGTGCWLLAGTREARRNFCLLECGPIVQKKVGGTCAHPATTSQIGGSSVSKRSQVGLGHPSTQPRVLTKSDTDRRQPWQGPWRPALRGPASTLRPLVVLRYCGKRIVKWRKPPFVIYSHIKTHTLRQIYLIINSNTQSQS